MVKGKNIEIKNFQKITKILEIKKNVNDLEILYLEITEDDNILR